MQAKRRHSARPYAQAMFLGMYTSHPYISWVSTVHVQVTHRQDPASTGPRPAAPKGRGAARSETSAAAKRGSGAAGDGSISRPRPPLPLIATMRVASVESGHKPRSQVTIARSPP